MIYSFLNFNLFWPSFEFNRKIFLNESWKKFHENCLNQNIISGFIRFNPFLKNVIAEHANFINIEKAKNNIF